ncbi:MAG: DUF4945 domain-containing protein [Tannerella sp.]|jgi:hypothetical protein|nr:DUF4945 domain-containing protein [Tannerella sp.]
MKKTVYLIVMTIGLCLSAVSCYDRSVLDEKEGVSLPAVTGLQSARSGNVVTLTWSIPSDIPAEISRPVSVQVQVLRYRPGVLSVTRVDTRTLPDEATTATYTIPEDVDNVGYEYHIVVKLTGNLRESVYGYSSQIFSPGQTVVVE